MFFITWDFFSLHFLWTFKSFAYLLIIYTGSYVKNNIRYPTRRNWSGLHAGRVLGLFYKEHPHRHSQNVWIPERRKWGHILGAQAAAVSSQNEHSYNCRIKKFSMHGEKKTSRAAANIMRNFTIFTSLHIVLWWLNESEWDWHVLKQALWTIKTQF
jgi:hypothetical protein